MTRLVDMGVPPYLVSSSVVGVLAQRLVRLLCPACKTRQPISMEVAREMDILDDPQKYEIYTAKGCVQCDRTGYRGRTVVAEVVTVDSELREMVTKEATEDELHRAAQHAGVKFMRHDWDWQSVVGCDHSRRSVASRAHLLAGDSWENSDGPSWPGVRAAVGVSGKMVAAS